LQLDDQQSTVTGQVTSNLL